METATARQRKCWTWSKQKCFGITEREMTSLGTENAVCTSRRALPEVENFGNGICICGQDESHLSMTSQHGTKARRDKSVPAGVKNKKK